jgi:hypothetical protein
LRRLQGVEKGFFREAEDADGDNLDAHWLRFAILTILLARCVLEEIVK